MADIVGGTIVWNLEVNDSKLNEGLSNANSQIKNLDKNSKNASDSINNSFSTTFKNIGTGLEKVGRDLSLRLTVPIVAAGTAIVKTSSDFQTAMQQIVGLVGVSQDQVNTWKEDILSLSKETAKSPIELAQAMYFITSSGLSGADALSVLKASAKAAASGLGQTQEVADLLSSAINAYGSNNLSAAHATDILVAAVKDGKAEAPAMAAALGRVIPVASQMGVSFDQVSAAVAAMTLTGNDAETATTQLRQILVSLLNPTKEATDTLTQYGLSAEGLRTQIKEKGLLSALDTLTTAIGDNDTAQGQIFGNVRALTGVMSLMGENLDHNKLLFEDVANSAGTMNTAFDVASNTAGFKMNQAMTSLQVSLIKMGDAVLPIVADAASKLATALTILSDLFSKIPTPIQSTVVVMLAVLAVIGPLTLVIGSLSTVIGILTGPIFGPLILVAIALIGWFTLLKYEFQKSGEIITNIWWPAIKNAVGWVSQKFGELGGIINSAVSNIFNIITKPFVDAWNYLSGIFDKIKNGIINALDPTVRHSPSLVDRITSGMSSIINQYERLGNMSLPSISSAFPNVSSGSDVTTYKTINNPIQSTSGVSVNIAQANINSQSDIDALGREFGFRYNLII